MIKDNIRSLHWEKWACRTFDAFTLSQFMDGTTEKDFDKIGLQGFRIKAQLFQLSYFYKSEEVWDDMAVRLRPILRKQSIFDITKRFAKFKKTSKEKIKQLLKSEEDSIKSLHEVYEILTMNCSYVWLAHGLEEYYQRILDKEVSKYIKKDMEKFIGDAAFPIKKNSHSLMEDEIRAGKPSKEIAKKYGWLKARGFGDPFTTEDIDNMRGKEHISRPDVKIPEELKQLFDEMKELVFYRTERSDFFYESLFLARPIFKKVAKKYSIPFKDFPNYTIQSLISGKLVKLGDGPCMATYEGETYIADENILEDEKVKKQDFVKGVVASTGKVVGKVKIIKTATEISKVKEGDILVTQMTFPAFIPAMVKAAAFVTDEGGLTCHAAIVSREMNKPCVIGTKIATKVFKDGDLVEVDADMGFVRKL